MRMPFVILWCFATVGCTGKSAPPVSVTGFKIDGAWAHCATYKGNLLIVVWSDLVDTAGGTSMSSGTSTSAERVKVNGRISRSATGKYAEFSVETTDGKTGAVVVNGKQFKLEDGAVFVVKSGENEVVQLKLDVSGRPAAREEIERQASETAEVKAFIESLPKAK